LRLNAGELEAIDSDSLVEVTIDLREDETAGVEGARQVTAAANDICISALVTVAPETAKLTVAMEVESMGPLNRTLTLLTSCMAPTLLMVSCAMAIGPLRPTRAAAKSVSATTLRMELNLFVFVGRSLARVRLALNAPAIRPLTVRKNFRR